MVLLFTQYVMYSATFFFLLFLKFILASEPADEHDDCEVNIHRDLNLAEPLLVTPVSPPSWVYPTPLAPTSIKLEENEHLKLVCGIQSVHITCIDGKFGVDGTKIRTNMRNFRCSRLATMSTIKPTKVGSCPVNVACYQIGFQVNLFDFLPTIDQLYMNPARKRPLWAHATILAVIGHRQHRGEKLQHDEANLFQDMSVSISQVFDKEYQKKRLTTILGSEALAEDYVNEKAKTIFTPEGQYLVRGQLIDHEDFFYKPQQDTAHYYANIMPIWHSVDEGNWQLTGKIVRKVAGDTKTNLELWSGGMGTLELEDAKGNKKPIYMATNATGQGVVPVPKILFKYVYDSVNNRGAVMLTINNPFIKKLTAEYVMCEEQPICHQLHSKFRIFQLGYTYCCSLGDFAAIAKKRLLPSFPNAKPLL